MAMPPRPAANVDLFDTYFRRADLDRDGRISGQEAVSFFQASGLPKNVLAQIWTYADQNHIGFLGRAEFYNALKLITVAQSKRELTSELVKAALFGPASSKIPAPQINLSAVPAQQPAAGSAPFNRQAGTNVPPVSQNPGVQGPQPQPLLNVHVNVHSAPPPGNSVVRPDQQLHGLGSGQRQETSALGSNGGLVGVTGLSSSSRSLVGVAPHTTSQGSAFSSAPVGSVPPGAAARPPRPPGPSAQMQPQIPSRGFRPPNVSGIASHSQTPWPKLTQSDIQKYTRVFVEVDTDRDGKIGGIQARDLFLSWRLPREILKQVWDLSDQDTDSMLSLKEFCIALYLMERYREGRPLPPALPNNILLDFGTIVQPMPGYNSGILKSTPGRQQQQPGKPGPGVHERPPSTGPRQPLPDLAPPTEDTQPVQQKSRVPILEKHLVDQLSKEEQDALNSKFREATESEKKVEELEKEIMESRQKIEFYRAKMQELVLYKSRCDNHINEIIERASADKREVELLSKKYEEKYKQMGDVASKLTIEEATFRDIQEKKMELYKAIVKMEQDGGDDGVTQGHADRIQQEIDVLVKSLNERCKKYGLRARPTSLVELPFGWQPGIQEAVPDWDEDWDKFEDEGFSFVKELTLDVQNVIAPPKTKSTSLSKEVTTDKTASSPVSGKTHADETLDKDNDALENGTEHKKTEDNAVESAPNSPAAGTPSESPSKESTGSHFKTNEREQSSPRFDKNKTESEHKGGDSISGDNRHDEPKWGRFDASDVADSLWGFNTDTATKDTERGNHADADAGNHNDNYFFDSGEFNLNPIKTGSSQENWSLPKKSSFTFDESVPSTPLNGGNSPLYGQGADYSFDKISRFDSFNMSDGGLFQPPESPSTLDFGQKEFSRFDSMRSTSDFDQGREFSRFDSMRSSNDFDHGKEFSRFDSMSSSSNFDGGRDFSNFDSMSNTGNFDNSKEFSRFDSMRSTSNYDVGEKSFSRFDSMRSTQDFNPTHGFPSFDDADPFGSTGPFKSSFESETPRSEYNSWGVSETPRRDSNNWGVSETPRRDSDSWSVSDPFGSTGPFKTSFDAETPRRTSFDSETPRRTTFDSETPRSTNNWSAF